MNRLIAYKQHTTANVVNDGTFVNCLDSWTPLSSSGNQIPICSSLANPITGVLDTVIKFDGQTAATSWIQQQMPTISGNVYRVEYNITKIFPSGSPTPSITITGGMAAPITPAPCEIGTNVVYFQSTQNDATILFRLNANAQFQGNNVDIFLDSISILEVNQYELDLFNDEEIVVTKEIDDIRNIDSKNSGYSKSFSLPSSKNNNQFFEHFYSLDDSGNWNPYEKAKAILIAEGVEVFNGFLKIDDVVLKDNHSIYNVTLFEELADLKTSIEGKTIGDLGWGGFAHNYTKANIVASINGNLQLLDGTTTDVFKYPMVNWIGDFDGNISNIFLNNFSDAFRPWVKIKYLFDKIFSDAGFSYSSTFLNSTKFSKLYMDWNFGEDFLMWGGGENDQGLFKVDTEVKTDNTGQQIPASNVSAVVDFDSIEQLQGSQNNTSDFFSLTTDTYTATEDNQQVKVNVNGYVQALSDFGNTIEVQMIHNSSVDGCLPSQFFQQNAPWVNNSFTEPDGTNYQFGLSLSMGFSATFTLNQGETIQIKIRRYGGGTPIVYTVGLLRTQFRVNGGEIFVPSTIQSRTSIKQFDLIKGLTQMFNLVMIPDESNSSHLKIEPASDYYGSGQTLDWTEKMDVKEMTIMPHEVAREYRFKMQHDDKDFNLDAYKSENPKEYGEHIKRHNFDVISEEIEVHENVLFAPTFMQLVSNELLPCIYGKKEGEFINIENKPRILYDNGQRIINAYQSNSENGAAFNNIEIGYFAPFNDQEPDSDTLQVDYGQSLTQSLGGLLPFKTLFYQYYLKILQQLTEKQSRILKAKVNLQPSDIYTFKFSDTIFFENQLYRVNKIDYNTTKGELSTVELIKLGTNAQFVNGKEGKKCEDVPTAIALNGDVYFVNGTTGNAVQPNQQCCEDYGYFWYSEPNGRCNMKQQNIGHGHGHVGQSHFSWSGGHSLVIGQKTTNGFGHGTKNSFVVGTKNVAQQNTKNVGVIGESNKLGENLENILVVGKNNRVDELRTTDETTANIQNSFVSGIGGFVKASNTRTFAMTTATDGLCQKTECIYKGTQVSDALVEIFLNGESGKRFPLRQLNSFLTIVVDIHGIVSDSASRDYGDYSRHRYIVTGSATGTNAIRVDDIDEVSTHSNHGSSWTIQLDVTAVNEFRIQVRANGIRENVEWTAHCEVIEQNI